MYMLDTNIIVDLLRGKLPLAHDAVLVTNNVKHFKRIKQLEVESWEEIILS